MSVSYNRLGKNGSLGNQMFQYAAAKAISNKLKTDLIIPWGNYQLTDTFILNNNLRYGYTGFEQVQETKFSYDENIINSLKYNIDIFGYFQSEKYFKEIENDLRNDFTFKNIYEIPNYDYVTVHVRRKDYLLLSNYHPVCDVEYYKKAMALFTNHKFIVLSDDLDWCKKQDVFVGCEFWQGTDAAHDMYVMTKAKHNIIANSSFSWWGAWLNQNSDKIVVAPEKWFGPDGPQDTQDLIPENWIKM